jgi:DNA-3-methyladenine glycosylase II
LSFAVISKNIDLQSLVNKTPLQVREELIKIKGIWTIDVYLMFCLQAPFVSAGDVAVVNTIKELLDIHEKKPWSYILKNGVRIARLLLLWHYYLKKKK